MSNKYVTEGKVIPWTNTTGSAVAVDQVVKVGSSIGVALGAIAIGAVGSVALEGVFSGVPKVAAAVFVQGEKLVFDISANGGLGAFDDSAATPATGDVTGGAIAWVAGANAETTCTIKLTPGNATVTA
jgi:predicted RecA/RadA family phage recombinase